MPPLLGVVLTLRSEFEPVGNVLLSAPSNRVWTQFRLSQQLFRAYVAYCLYSIYNGHSIDKIGGGTVYYKGDGTV